MTATVKKFARVLRACSGAGQRRPVAPSKHALITAVKTRAHPTLRAGPTRSARWKTICPSATARKVNPDYLCVSYLKIFYFIVSLNTKQY